MTPQRFLAFPQAGKLVLDEPGRWSGLLAKLEGKRIQVVVEMVKARRTLSQNAYFHGVVVPAISEWSGNSEPETKQGLKQKFLSKVNILPTGEEMETVRSTADLTLEEFTKFLDECHAWAAQSGCIIPTRDELSA